MKPLLCWTSYPHPKYSSLRGLFGRINELSRNGLTNIPKLVLIENKKCQPNFNQQKETDLPNNATCNQRVASLVQPCQHTGVYRRHEQFKCVWVLFSNQRHYTVHILAYHTVEWKTAKGTTSVKFSPSSNYLLVGYGVRTGSQRAGQLAVVVSMYRTYFNQIIQVQRKKNSVSICSTLPRQRSLL